MVGLVLISRVNILVFWSSIYLRRMVRLRLEQVLRLRPTSLSCDFGLTGILVLLLLISMMRWIMLSLFFSMSFRRRMLPGRELWCLSPCLFLESTLLLARMMLTRCLRWASVRQRISSRSLRLRRFQELACIFIEYGKYGQWGGGADDIILMSEEQQKIQKYLIKSTPYGELNEVLKDLQKLTPLDILSPTISAAIQDYHEEHLALFPLKEGKYPQFPLMACSKVEPGKYLDQLNKKTYTVDHLKREIVGEEAAEVELAEPVEQLLTHLSESAHAYAARYFKEPFGAGVFMHQTEEALDTYVGITGKNVQLGNFYTGEWVSRWKVGKNSVEGTVSVKAHFFESGNVQFQQKKNFNLEFQFEADMQQNAKNIMALIEKSENQVQSQLNQLYEQMEDGFFKKLRRIAPFTKTKMVWNVNAVKMNKNILGLGKE